MSKIGILEFRYGNSKRFAKRLRRTGSYTINVGDWIQSLAVQSLLESIGVARENLVRIDRDTLPSYQGPPVRLIMNACFLDHCFPLPAQVEPVFVGFQTSSRELIRNHLELFKQHQPIGCRDTATRDLFREQGVDCYVTGCLTMTVPLRQERPTTPKTFFIGGEGAGEMPKTLKKHAPPAVLQNAVYQHQREPVTSFPLSDKDALMAEDVAAKLLDTYRREATLVVTPLLHAAGPCLAMGIPVVLARKDYKDRFTAISRLLPVYTPEDFSAIDWNPACQDVEPLKATLRALVAGLLQGESPGTTERQFLTELYEKEAGPTEALLASRASRKPPSFVQRLPFVGRLFGS